jgi:hypothetical protein
MWALYFCRRCLIWALYVTVGIFRIYWGHFFCGHFGLSVVVISLYNLLSFVCKIIVFSLSISGNLLGHFVLPFCGVFAICRGVILYLGVLLVTGAFYILGHFIFLSASSLTVGVSICDWGIILLLAFILWGKIIPVGVSFLASGRLYSVRVFCTSP